MCFHWLKGNATVKNVSGDTVIGKQADSLIAQWTTYGIYQWLVKANHLRLALFLQMVRIVSWRFPLTADALMSMWGTVAVPNSTVRTVNTQYKKNIHLLNHSFPSWALLCHSFSVFIPHSSVVCRSRVCARPLLVESWGGALWSVGGYQPRGCSAWSRKQHSWRPNHSYWWAIIFHLHHTPWRSK